MIKKKFRLIPRLDIKGEHLIKGINLEGLRKIGSPKNLQKIIIIQVLMKF